jgi:hypothetical protein
MGEGGGFPRIRVVMSLMNPRLFVARPNTKVFQHCVNQLVGWFCAGSCEWIVYLSLFLVPSRSSSTPLYLRKCWESGSVPEAPNLSIIFYFRLTCESIEELGTASINIKQDSPNIISKSHRSWMLWVAYEMVAESWCIFKIKALYSFNIFFVGSNVEIYWILMFLKMH